MINRKKNTPLQYTFCSKEFFLQLDIILSTVGIKMDGIIWTPGFQIKTT